MWRLCERSGRDRCGKHARQDSNLRPCAPEAHALSTELRARVPTAYRPTATARRSNICSVRSARNDSTMDTISRGNTAEAAVLHALVRAHIPVMVPFGGGWCFDLAAEQPSDGRVLRIQVKCGRVRGACVLFNTCSTDHGNGRQHYRGRVDLLAVHVAALDRVFMVPAGECPSFVGSLRLAPPLNNQRARVRMAEEYDFQRWAEAVC